MRNFTDVTLLIDRSWSMDPIKQSVIEGINGFVQEQKRVPGDGCWTVIYFDGGYEDWYNPIIAHQSQEHVPQLNLENYRPRGNTPLNAAMCRAIDEAGKRFAAMPEHERPDKVLFVVMTDGEENSSQHYGGYTKADVKKRVELQQSRYSWQFVFMGANVDAFAEAASYGIPKTHALQYAHTNEGARIATRSASLGLRSWKVEGNDTAKGFFQEPQKEVNVNVTVNKK